MIGEIQPGPVAEERGVVSTKMLGTDLCWGMCWPSPIVRLSLVFVTSIIFSWDVAY